MEDSKYSILYIDDEKDNLDVFEASFWKEYTVYLAISALEALEVLRTNQIHLIITDQKMPETTGIEFLEEVMIKYPDPNRIILTGYSDSETIIDAINIAKVFHFVNKPWKRDSLKQVMDNALENYQLKEENKQLLKDLKKSNGQLVDLNNDLEEKVKERTHELSQKNEVLAETLFQLKSMQSQLVQSERLSSLGMLSAAIGHEINNPLGLVVNGLDAIKTNLDSVLPLIDEAVVNDDFQLLKSKLEGVKFGERKKDLENIVDDVISGGHRLTSIINSLRSFSRSGANKLEYADIHEGLNSVLILLNSRIVDSSINIKTDYDTSIPKIPCISGPLNLVFMNLIVNAIDALNERFPSVMGEEKQIKVKTFEIENTVSISITDNGIGMSANVLQNIFEPFYTTKAIGKGIGLGMAIAKDIIDKHNGELLVDSYINEGTTFTIELPVQQE